MEWKTGEIPKGLKCPILVKYREDFVHTKDYYIILGWCPFFDLKHPEGYYEQETAEGPMGLKQIEKWCKIE